MTNSNVTYPEILGTDLEKQIYTAIVASNIGQQVYAAIMAAGAGGGTGGTVTVTVGTVTALPASSSPTVTNSGTTTNAVFDFGIPAGEKGDTGAEGPKGEQGVQGSKGDTGPTGTAGTVTVGTVTTVDAGEPATVTNSGTENAAVLNFEIPRGEKGEDGAGGSHVYSTDEKVVGTWIDGKPVYERTFKGKTTNKAALVPAGTVDSFIQYSGSFSVADGRHLGLYSYGTESSLFPTKLANGGIGLQCVGTYVNRPFIATFRYTKNTD